ncbi:MULTISPECIES: CD1871A family CXXC motif-containing protein [Oscillospiraceae]|nr:MULTISPECIES: CD1871A family CXXC motif-containing protein [Oscillospiraceae]MCQ4864081.1 CD1871A family CXXC motif-containing protein [Pseudoflavonifractor phocaeensis]
MSFLRKNRSAAAVLLIGLLFVAVGVWRGEVEVVFRKAVNICMECIGLG